jgi:hypothetical protein
MVLIPVGCRNNEVKRCLIKEAIVGYPDTGLYFFKRDFIHDGTNYSEIHEHAYDQVTKTFSDAPTSTTKITYANGRISKTVMQDVLNGRYVQRTFSYTVDGDITNVHISLESGINGNVDFTNAFDSHFIQTKSGVYLTKDDLGKPILESYENGNLTKIAVQSPKGSYAAYDTTWSFSSFYIYDNKPNVASEYIIQDMIANTPNWGLCTNSAVEYLTVTEQGDSIPQKWTFYTSSDSRLEKYVLDGTRQTVTLSYTCQ